MKAFSTTMNGRLANTIIACLLVSFATASHPLLSSTSQATRDSNGKGPWKASVGKPHPEDPNPSDHYANAQKLLNEGKFQEAVQEYRLSLENQPDNDGAHFGMALAFTHLGKTGEAIQSYQAVLQINPKIWEAELNWGIVLLSQQDLEGAIAHFQKAKSLNPGNFQTIFLEGKAQELAGNPANALSSLLQALPLAKNEKDQLDVHAALGSIYLKQRNWKEAENHLAMVREGGKKDVQLDLNLAQIYLETDQMEKCVSLLKPLADENPQEAEVQEMMARILVKKGDVPGAIHYFQLAINQQTDKQRRQNLMLDLAAVYEKSGQSDKALIIFRQEAATSVNPQLHFHLGTLCMHQKDYDCALRSFLTVLQLRPDFIDCYSNLGAAFMMVEKYPEAIAALSKFKGARPEIPGTYFYLGLAYDKLKDIPDAMSNYQRFLELDQGKSDVQNFQARERLKVLKKSKKR
jgi:tetratricopeptide (TPR) repeat protein